MLTFAKDLDSSLKVPKGMSVLSGDIFNSSIDLDDFDSVKLYGCCPLLPDVFERSFKLLVVFCGRTQSLKTRTFLIICNSSVQSYVGLIKV